MAFPIIGAIPIIGDALKGIFDIIDKAVPDKDAAEKMKHEIALKTMENQVSLQHGQIDTNKIEAANQRLFVSGWRPAIGWTCAMALFWHFIGYDIATWVTTFMNIKTEIPRLMSGDYLMELVFAMLGLASLRTVDKLKQK